MTSRVPSRTGHEVHLETSCFKMTAKKVFSHDLCTSQASWLLFRLFFQQFPIIRHIWPHLTSFNIICCIYGARKVFSHDLCTSQASWLLFRLFFQQFPIIRNIWPHLSSFNIICCIYGKRSLPLLGYGHI